jgi:hypothetical protein
MRGPSVNKLGSPAFMNMTAAPSQMLGTSNLDLLQMLVQSITRSKRVTIQCIESGRGRLYSLRYLQLSDGSRLVLKISPMATTHLLKSEHQDLATEARLLMILANSGLPIPYVLSHDNSPRTLGSPYLLTNQLEGIPLADILPFVSRAERMEIDRQIHNAKNIMTQYVSPTFGPVTLVSSGHGFKRWREAFRSMLAGILKDGEDMYVNLPYATIREQVAQSESALDDIQEASLVVLDLGNPDNVLVNERTKRITGFTDLRNVLWGDADMMKGDADMDTRRLL